jgi:predicted RNase H-like nuclease (RuvC/YqgF family)
MDRLISWLRVWLGISAESTSVNARLAELEENGLKDLKRRLEWEELTDKQLDNLNSRLKEAEKRNADLRAKLDELVEEVSTLYLCIETHVQDLKQENHELRTKLDEVHRFSESLSLQLDTLRNIMVIRPAEPKPVRVRNWTDAKQHMPDEMVGIMEAK